MKSFYANDLASGESQMQSIKDSSIKDNNINPVISLRILTEKIHPQIRLKRLQKV